MVDAREEDSSVCFAFFCLFLATPESKERVRRAEV